MLAGAALKLSAGRQPAARPLRTPEHPNALQAFAQLALDRGLRFEGRQLSHGIFGFH